MLLPKGGNIPSFLSNKSEQREVNARNCKENANWCWVSKIADRGSTTS